MTTTQKIAIAAGALALTALIGWYFWKKSWKEFSNIGDSTWLPTERNGKLAIRPASKMHGIKPGNRIEIEHANSQVPQGEAVVLDVVEKNGYPYIVTSLDMTTNPDISGKFRWIG